MASLKKDYAAIFQGLVAQPNQRSFSGQFRAGFRTIKNFKWSNYPDYGCSMTDAKGSPIPIWDILDTLDNPNAPQYKEALFFLLGVDWYGGLPRGEGWLREGPACWAKLYGRILHALAGMKGSDRVWHVCHFLKKLRFILTRGDTSIYHAPDGLDQAISSSLRILSEYDMTQRGETRIDSQLTTLNVFDVCISLEMAYVAIREYYHLVLVKQNLKGNEVLAGILDVLIPAALNTPALSRSWQSIGHFLVSQIPAPHLTMQSRVREKRGRIEARFYEFDDFTCEQLAKIGTPGLEAIAWAAIGRDPFTVASAEYVRKFLDSQLMQQLDERIAELKMKRNGTKEITVPPDSGKS